MRAYVKNEGLGFIDSLHAQWRAALIIPDFIARVNDGRGEDDLLNLIIEVSGQEYEARAPRRRPHDTSGFRRSTISASTAAGPYRGQGPLGRRSRPARGSRDPRPRSRLDGTQKGKTAHRPRSTPFATRTSAATSRPTSCAASSPRTRRNPSSCLSTLANRSGSLPRPPARLAEARTSRTPTTSLSPPSPSTSRRKSTHKRSSRICAKPPKRTSRSPSCSLFDDFNGIEFEELVDFYRHARTGRTG